MGIIKRGILGGFSNKVANVVGSSWKGIAVIKALPLSVANPNTVAQQEVRSSFSNCSKFASSILASIIKPLWDRYAQQMSGYNAFVMQNVSIFNQTGLANPSGLVTSKGTWGVVDVTGAGGSVSGQDVTVEWDDALTKQNQAANDQIFIVVYDRDTNKVVATDSTHVRSDASATLAVASPIFLSDSLWAYVSSKDVTGRYVSDSTAYNDVVGA